MLALVADISLKATLMFGFWWIVSLVFSAAAEYGSEEEEECAKKVTWITGALMVVAFNVFAITIFASNRFFV